MTGAKTYFVTTAIDYVNNLPHIGTAYEKICADVIARFKRLEGEPVFFLMGNDEHSINVKREAQARGLEPHAYCDQMADQFRQIWKSLGISYDAFIRTTEERHAEAVSKLFQRIYENGDIYPSKYSGLYCESCEAFYREKDLADGKCPQHGSEPKWIEEDNYFFALSRYTEKILKIIEEKRLLILPEIRKNEIMNILHGGLEDISISRSSFDWGIPLPIQPDHVIYVWFDALINYISAIGFGWDEDLFPQFWPADMHIVGKDITRFHCIIWPAMLLSAGLEVPRMVFGHGFVSLKGEKMSKTLGNVVTPMDIVDVYGPDALRYYLLRDSSFGKDGNFTWENFLERYNGDLANDFGNLLQRVLTMIRRYRSGTIPTPHTLEEEDEIRENFEKVAESLVWAETEIIIDPLERFEGGSESAFAELTNKLADEAKSEFVIETAYLIPAQEGIDNVAEMTERGVRVRILTNSLRSNNHTTVHAHYKKYRKPMIEAGVELHELRPDPEILERHKQGEKRAAGSRAGLHTKSFVVDRRLSMIGSYNMDPRSRIWNSEIGLLIDSEEFAENVLEIMETDLDPANSYRVTLDEKGKLVWTAEGPNGPIIWHKEPETTAWQRFTSRFLRWIPMEKEL